MKPPPKTLSALAVPLDIEAMEAKLVEHLPEGDWQFEPKWDGFRCLAFRAGGEVDLKAKSGKPLARYFPEMVATLKRLPQRSFVFDGELAIVKDGDFSFDALLQRIHPAESRIKLLAAETPAIFILFDLLLDPSGKSLIEAPLTERRAALEAFFASAKRESALKLSPYSLSLAEARRWLRQGGTALDGVVAKLRDGPYVPGERAMMKVKQRRTADCVVGTQFHSQNKPRATVFRLILRRRIKKCVGLDLKVTNLEVIFQQTEERVFIRGGRFVSHQFHDIARTPKSVN